MERRLPYNVDPMSRQSGFLSAFLVCTLFAGCGSGKDKDGPEIVRLDQTRILNDTDTELHLTGSRLKGTVKILLWAGTPERLQRQVAVTGLKVSSDNMISFTVPAGTLPGKYMVVVQTETHTTFSGKLLLTLEEREKGVSPRVVRVQGELFSDVPSRIYLVGPGIGELDGVSVAGSRGKASLSYLRAYSAARLGASLEEGTLEPGSYQLRLGRGADWIDGPVIKVRESGYAADGLLCFSIYFLVLGGIFFVGLFLAHRQGDVGLATSAQKRNLVMLLSGLVFTFVMLGSVQFGLAWWR